MTKPQLFTINSDYASLKNDGSATLSLTIPQMILNPGQLYSQETSITVGQKGASERTQITSSKTGRRYVSNILSISRNGYVSGVLNPYSIVVELYRSSDTVLTARISILNPYSENITTETDDEVFNFYIKTFLPPFPV